MQNQIIGSAGNSRAPAVAFWNTWDSRTIDLVSFFLPSVPPSLLPWFFLSFFSPFHFPELEMLDEKKQDVHGRSWPQTSH